MRSLKRLGGASLVLALDVDTPQLAIEVLKQTYKHVHWYKLGAGLMHHPYCHLIFGEMKRMQDANFSCRLFYDGKLYDIPSQIERAAKSLSMNPLVGSMSVVVKKDSIRAAKAGSSAGLKMGYKTPEVWGLVTMTSLDEAFEVIQERASLALDEGADGLICPVPTAERLGQLFPSTKFICPGISLDGSPKNDHKQAGSPKEAVEAGASYVVVGREILQSKSRIAALKLISENMGRAF